MKLYIKYMVSVRCKTMVQAKLDELGLHYGMVDLGEMEFKQSISPRAGQPAAQPQAGN